MRIKLSHLIGVSLISLTVAFSAINTSEGARSDSIFGDNTSGGGSTAYLDNDTEEDEGNIAMCDMFNKTFNDGNKRAYEKCLAKGGGGSVYGTLHCLVEYNKMKAWIKKDLQDCYCRHNTSKCKKKWYNTSKPVIQTTPPTTAEETEAVTSKQDPVLNSGGGTVYEVEGKSGRINRIHDAFK